ncbi:MAG TPA: hypothetical protein VGA06_01975 [Candidatus Paceibacterota bacterium]
MEPLSAFFNKFKNFEPPERSIKRATQASIEKEIGVTISLEQIQVARDAVVVHAPSVVKSEIKLHEKEILEEANAALSKSKRRIKTLR